MSTLKTNWDKEFEDLMHLHENQDSRIHHAGVSAEYAFKLLNEFVELFPGIPGVKRAFVQWKEQAEHQEFI